MWKYLKRFIKIIAIILFQIFIIKANIIINEIYPSPGYQQIEWIELFNNSIDTIILSKGYINDEVSSKVFSNIVIPPRFYAIFTKDTTNFLKFWGKTDSCLLYQFTLPTLNNDKDIVVIKNYDSTIIDSIYYTFKSNKKGFSLERIKPDVYFDFQNNWGYSESSDSSTPGKWNSISNQKTCLLYTSPSPRDS